MVLTCKEKSGASVSVRSTADVARFMPFICIKLLTDDSQEFVPYPWDMTAHMKQQRKIRKRRVRK